mmetsp:Transcript_831/g.2359  ORF Transcript_831/g.2359 Transcript_831/m.2359 type:complete len:83 (-) Transcript_831:393-641(-)
MIHQQEFSTKVLATACLFFPAALPPPSPPPTTTLQNNSDLAKREQHGRLAAPSHNIGKIFFSTVIYSTIYAGHNRASMTKDT